MKKTAKKIGIISSAILLTAAVGVYLFSSQESEVLSWMDSSWLYRRSISVSNPGSELTNEDVLIEYDTATLITGGKLQNDCDDLRFVDSDDSTALAYWVEGGCNTSTTHIWVRIPTLPNGGKTIYMYYGNGSATNAEESWTGKFITMKDSACDSGWTTESNSGGDFYQTFPKAAASYGTTGGASSHSHPDTTFTTSNNSTNTVSVKNLDKTEHAIDPHTHSVTLSTQSTSVLPTYLDMLFCSNTDLIVKQDMVAYFDATAPSGFTRFSALDSALPRGNSSYTGTQGGSTTHSHTVDGATTGAPSSTDFSNTGTDVTLTATTHTHTFPSSTSGDGNHMPEYLTMIFGQADSDTMAPASAIVMSNATPPLGWTRFSALDSYYPYGASSYGTTGGNPNHTHSVSVTSGNESATVQAGSGSPSANEVGSHTHDVTGNLNTASNDPPYITTVFIKKNTSESVTVNNEETENVAPDAPSSLYTEGTTNPSDVTDLTPEFSAVFTDDDTADTGEYYEIEVNTNNTFTGTVMWDSAQQSISSITNGARSSDISYGNAGGSPVSLTQDGSTYYWRIKFWDSSDNESTWSSTAQFTMYTNVAPDAPSSLLTEGSTNPTKVTDLTPEFSAVFTDTDTPDTGEYYQIEVNTQSDFLGTSMWDSTKTSITSITNGARSSDIPYAGSALSENGTTYYWRIKFWDNYDNESSWSTTQQFTMSGPPNAPTSLLTEGATDPTGVTDLTPEFSAIHTDPNGDSTSNYEIEVNTQSDFLGTSMWDTGQTAITVAHNARSADISYNGTALSLDGSTYYWRIRFWDTDSKQGDWSSTAQFTMSTNTPPDAPSTPYAEGTTNPTKVTDLTPEFSAVFSDDDVSDTGDYYEIEVDTANTFDGTRMWDTGQTAITSITNGSRSSDISYVGTALTQDGTTYYWRMRFWDNYDAVSNWSSTAQFTMSGPPNAPTSLEAEGSTNPTDVTDLTPEFTAIHTDPNADSTSNYEIEVDTANTFDGTRMWDTGQTAITVAHNARSAEISYNGTTLSLDGTTYYWRIKFWDTDTNEGEWSSTGQFTMYTNYNPDPPSSLYTEGSTNPVKVTDLTPEFSAVFTDDNTSDTGEYYEIEVNTQSDFLGTSMWDSNKQSISSITNGARSSDISYAGTALTENGTTYYWRIKFWDNYDAESTWSTTQQFTMSGPPNAPTSLLTEGATNPTGVTDITPEFSAIHTDPNGDSTAYYEIEVDTANTFDGTRMWDTGQSAITVANNARSADISYNGTALARDGSTYYWRIRFWDTDSKQSDWSSTAQFTMYTNVAPNAPSSLYTEGSTNPIKVTDTTPEFSAVFSDSDAFDTGNSYEIEVNTASDFTGTVMWDSDKQSTGPITNGTRSADISYNGSALSSDGTTYYWRIRFWDESDVVSNWSSTAQFTMSGPPDPPSTPYAEGETNPTTVTDLTPEFSAIHTDPNTDSTASYEIEVDTANTFDGTRMWDTGKQSITVANNTRSTDITYTPSNLSLDGTTYYWRIRFWDTDDQMGDWSTTQSFTMYNNFAPNAPSSLETEATTNPLKVTDTTPEFSAIFSDSNGSDTGESYQIEVNTQSDFLGTSMWSPSKASISSITNGTRSSLIPYAGTALTTDGSKYYWRIKFWDNWDEESAWSATGEFTMDGPPSQPTGLLVDGRTNPSNIDSTTPQFSAIYTDPNEDSGVYYEIEVDSANTFDGTRMWDTDKTAMTSTTSGTRSPDFAYDGTPLTGSSGTTYYWRIRFWDTDDKVSEWSQTATFVDTTVVYMKFDGVNMEGVKIN